ncbi:hypothetical protein PF011_g6626 [Phytophthora fragariae]|uniref:Uncharacterized protein n=3 Tax=Phytophthora fragariae TaxID=53985 RepID=A0A6A3LDV7_9STRA|nr:hypothetical protein PF011_g6626 [Phytophthora fragariae]
MGMVELIMEFEKTMTEDFKSVAELFQTLRNVRNRLNRQGQETLRVHLLPSQLMIVKLLAMLPGHLWGHSVTFLQEEFTLEKIETKLKSIFGNKSKAEIQAMGKTTQRPIEIPVNYASRGMAGAKKEPMKKSGKRKTMMLPTDVEQANACFYCKGVHNYKNGIGPHFKKDCPMRKEDMTKGVGRKDIFSEPRPLKVRKTDHSRVQKVQPAPKMKEIPVDAAVLQRLNINEPMASDTAVTPGGVQLCRERVKVTAAAEELEEKAKAFEDTDADMD